jgi:hypothetical protein
MARRWKQPNDPTGPAREVWAALFPGEPWPKGWKVRWAGFMRGALGLCIHGEKRILLSYGDHRRPGRHGPVETLVHEFVHLRCPRLRHGQEFRALERALFTRIGLVEPHEETP